jgi:inositol transport system ATP-binding protein
MQPSRPALGKTGLSFGRKLVGDEAPLLELRLINKSFPGVRALTNMSISFRRAAVHVICGENGAGKSTLMKIVNGLHQPDSGEIWIDGERVHVKNPIEARARGISMISQELNYIPEITVEEALFLGIEPVNRMGRIDWPQIRERTKALLSGEGLKYDPKTKLKDLSVSDIQMLEIMKAVSQQANIIIMDEPTSAITAKEVEILFAKIDKLRTKGAAIIYISHRLDELFRIADDLTVIRDGTHVSTRPAKDFTIDSVVQLMVGRSIQNVFPPRPERRFGTTALEVEGLFGEKFRDVDFHIRKGEIVGFSGLMGAGRTEVARTIFGLDPAAAGAIRIDDKPATIRSPADGMERGMAMLSEDRKRYGLVPVRDIKENVGLSSLSKFIFGGFLHKKTENDLVSSICSRMRVKAPTLGTRVEALSGGNQQKVVFAKWMLRDPDILILDEPTRGIDVGAKYEIYKIIFELAEEGKAILLISSELPEILALCDRMYVMAQGQIACELQGPHFDQERIMRFATMGASASELEASEREAAELEASAREASRRAGDRRFEGG